MVKIRALLELSSTLMHLMKIKRQVELILSEEPSDFPLVRLGSEYGGWTFVPFNNLEGSWIVSAGLGEDASFDSEILHRYGAKVLILDPTPRAISHFEAIKKLFGHKGAANWVQGGNQPVTLYDLSSATTENMVLIPKALWNKTSRLRFYSPTNPSHVSHSINNFQNDYRSDTPFIEVDSTTLKSVLENLDQDHLPLLKLDIEGAEIEVIQNFLDDGLRPTQLLVEYDELVRPTKKSNLRIQRIHNRLVNSGYALINWDKPSNFLYLDSKSSAVHLENLRD